MMQMNSVTKLEQNLRYKRYFVVSQVHQGSQKNILKNVYIGWVTCKIPVISTSDIVANILGLKMF